MRTIEIHDYNPEWKNEFLRLKNRFIEIFGNIEVDIQHVGSTSVVGLVAKPIIDIDIIVKNNETKIKTIRILELHGYIHLGDLGITGREAFKRKDFDVPYDNGESAKFPHNLYVCIDGITSLQNHLNFRNYLRMHPEAVLLYSELKRELASKYPHDIDSYIDGKTAFITNILAKTGIKSFELGSIIKQNKKD